MGLLRWVMRIRCMIRTKRSSRVKLYHSCVFPHAAIAASTATNRLAVSKLRNETLVICWGDPDRVGYIHRSGRATSNFSFSRPRSSISSPSTTTAQQPARGLLPTAAVEQIVPAQL
jgi:hypothetical protein